MKVDINLLNKLSSDLSFKLVSVDHLNNAGDISNYHLINEGLIKGRVCFQDKAFLHEVDDSVNVLSLMLHYVRSGLGTKVVRVICDYAQTINARRVLMISPLKTRDYEEDLKGFIHKLTKKKRIKVFMRIGKSIGLETFYDKSRDEIVYLL